MADTKFLASGEAQLARACGRLTMTQLSPKSLTWVTLAAGVAAAVVLVVFG
jgi:hypothetical protein